MSYCYKGSFFAPARCQFVVPCMIKRVFCPCGCPCDFCQHSFNLFVSPGCPSAFFLPALSLFPGDIPAHEAKCFSVGKTLMSNPISATRSSTLLELIPGTFLSSSNAFSYGDKTSFIRRVRLSIVCCVPAIS